MLKVPALNSILTIDQLNKFTGHDVVQQYITKKLICVKCKLEVDEDDLMDVHYGFPCSKALGDFMRKCGTEAPQEYSEGPTRHIEV